MLDALKSLFENNVISEEIKADIENAWNSRIKENREQVTIQLREEFAQKYEHDKQIMAEAVAKMLSDRLAEEIQEFVEDRKGLAEAKARYALAIRENSKKLQSFVLETLSKEINELYEDQKLLTDNFKKLEEFIISALAKEISDFYTDKKDLAETKVRLVKEAKTEFTRLKSNFIKQSANLVENVITKTLSKEIGQLREDIDRARENDFGRRIFEAFTNEYQHSLLNEKSETAKMLRVVQQKDQELAEAKKVLIKAQKIIENKDRTITQVKDISARKEIMNELLSPLSKEQQSIMSELLESVQTVKLRTSYDKYLPAVLTNKTTVNKRVLAESKVVTGNKETNSISSAKGQGEVIDIRRLAGIK